jgi:uncharacterized membrane protein
MTSTKKLCYTALMTAVTFVMIFAVRIPIPNGYIHLGDAAVFLSGYILGPVLGPLAACIGAASADYLSGFSVYIIPTIFAKGTMAWLTAYGVQKSTSRAGMIAAMTGGALAMTAIYYISEILIYGNAISPLVDVPFNLLQAGVGLGIAVLLFKPLQVFRLAGQHIN